MARSPCVLLITENGMGMRVPLNSKRSEAVSSFGKQTMASASFLLGSILWEV